MHLIGLSLGQVLLTLGVAAVAVVVLYLLKLRRRQTIVPFVKLWQDVLAEKQSTRLFSQLKRWLSLFVSLLIVGMLAFALGDPRQVGAGATGRTLVVLLDASASMGATDVARGRFARAKEKITGLIDALGPADRMLIAQMDSSSRPLGPMSSDPAPLREALARAEVTHGSANLDAGIRFALDVLRGQSSPEIAVVSDGRLSATPETAERLSQQRVRLSFVPIGRRGRNVAISAFSVRRYPLDKSTSEVLVELYNPSGSDENVELTLVGDGAPVDVQRLLVKRGERLQRFFGNISGVDRTLEARLRLANGTHDDLGIDDHAYARLPDRRRARILCVSEGNLYLQAALLLDEALLVTEITPAQYPAAGEFDAIIFDAWVPPSTPPTNALYLYPQETPGHSPPFPLEGMISRPSFEQLDRNHPLLRWTALSEVNIAEALHLGTEEGDRIVASSREGPLIVAGSRGGHKMVALAFDVRQSDLPLRVAWPLLLLNSIDWFAEDSGDYLSSYRVGEAWHIPVAAGVTEATVVDPQGHTKLAPVTHGRAVFTGDEVGFYTLRTRAGDEVFAANLGSSDESDIMPAQNLAVAGTRASSVTTGTVGVRQEIWLYLVALVLLIVAAEWLTYHRRWTV